MVSLCHLTTAYDSQSNLIYWYLLFYFAIIYLVVYFMYDVIVRKIWPY